MFIENTAGVDALIYFHVLSSLRSCSTSSSILQTSKDYPLPTPKYFFFLFLFFMQLPKLNGFFFLAYKT